jgi:hypothetical protein
MWVGEHSTGRLGGQWTQSFTKPLFTGSRGLPRTGLRNRFFELIGPLASHVHASGKKAPPHPWAARTPRVSWRMRRVWELGALESVSEKGRGIAWERPGEIDLGRPREALSRDLSGLASSMRKCLAYKHLTLTNQAAASTLRQLVGDRSRVGGERRSRFPRIASGLVPDAGRCIGRVYCRHGES